MDYYCCHNQDIILRLRRQLGAAAMLLVAYNGPQRMMS